MILTYKNEKLENVCENHTYNKKLVKKYGSEVAQKLPLRIKQLKSFTSLDEIPTNPPFRRHKLTGKRQEQYRLIFKSKENNIIIEELKEIKEIEIMEVSKHYE